VTAAVAWHNVAIEHRPDEDEESHAMEETGHGHSLAAWTGVTTLLVAALLIGLGIFFGWPWANWTGIGLAVVGVAAWYGLHAAGHGGLTAEHDLADAPEGQGRQEAGGR
jgi:hypothetical protein